MQAEHYYYIVFAQGAKAQYKKKHKRHFNNYISNDVLTQKTNAFTNDKTSLTAAEQKAQDFIIQPAMS